MKLFNIFKKPPPPEVEEEACEIDIARSHPRARELIQEDFFWDGTNKLAPFGTDVGDTALAEYRRWRQDNPESPLKECLVWTIEDVGEMDFGDYSESVLRKELIQSQIEDFGFDDDQYIFTLDISVIGAGFGQLVDEGRIDPDAKPIVSIAIQRLIIWAGLKTDWGHASEFISNLKVLARVLEAA